MPVQVRFNHQMSFLNFWNLELRMRDCGSVLKFVKQHLLNMTYTVSTWMASIQEFIETGGKIMQQLAKMYSPLGSLLKYCKTSDYYVSEKA